MIHLITVVGKSAKNFYLERQYISDFKSLMRTVTSGRVMIISTKFRSDLFYNTEKPRNKEILKMWALYANTSLTGLDRKDFTVSDGDEKSLSRYFLSINQLSTNWYHYWLYRKAFHYMFSNDQQNPVAKTVVQCDQYLIEHTSTKRTPLIGSNEMISPKLTKDTLAIAMYIIKNGTRSN